MTKLNEIPIQVISMEQGLTQNVIALLHEVVALQNHFLETGEAGQIDLKSLPLNGSEHEALHTILAYGEVRATLEAMGHSQIWETQLSGVWRISHYNGENELIAEHIEVCRIPAILQADDEEIRRGARALNEQLEALGEDFDARWELADE